MLRRSAKVIALFLIVGSFSSNLWASDNIDPWEKANRKIYAFNKAADTYVLKPIAKGYRAITPQIVDNGITRFFDNLKEPLVSLNNGLQGKGKQAASDMGRFIVNTVTSVGFADVAQKIGLVKHEEDFGQTFGVWGAKSGIYVMLPFFGPSSIRDALGKPLDAVVHPSNLLDSNQAKVGLYAVEVIDGRADLIPVEKIIEGDEYVLLRDVYLQRREFLVHDGQVKDTFMEDFGDDDNSAPAAP